MHQCVHARAQLCAMQQGALHACARAMLSLLLLRTGARLESMRSVGGRLPGGAPASKPAARVRRRHSARAAESSSPHSLLHCRAAMPQHQHLIAWCAERATTCARRRPGAAAPGRPPAGRCRPGWCFQAHNPGAPTPHASPPHPHKCLGTRVVKETAPTQLRCTRTPAARRRTPQAPARMGAVTPVGGCR